MSLRQRGIQKHSTDLEPGALVDRDFEIVRLAGRGSFSTVYEAHQRSRKSRRLAIKILHRGIQQQIERQAGHVRNPYLKEQLLCQRIKDTAVCRILKVGATEDGRYYVALEWADGVTLEDYQRSHRDGLSDRQVADVLAQTGRTLAAMHRNRVVHRDIKPSNIMVAERDTGLAVKILDFGIAKLAEEDELAAGEGQLLVGTPAYMSPEAAAGMATDPRSDIFSMAAIAYELVTGARHIQLDPARRGSDDFVSYLLSAKPIPSFPASYFKNELTPDLDRILTRALSRSIKYRPATVEAFMEELMPILHANEVAKPPPSRFARMWRRLTRRDG